jgi:hypothetical protein
MTTSSLLLTSDITYPERSQRSLSQVMQQITDSQPSYPPHSHDFLEDEFDDDMTPWATCYDQEDQRENQELDQSEYQLTIKSLLRQEQRLSDKCHQYRQRYIRNWKILNGIKTKEDWFAHQDELPMIITKDTIRLAELRGVLENMIPEWRGRTW